MAQQDRDRLVALKKAKKRLITQRQAAEEIGRSERQVRRLLRKLKSKGDQAIVHASRGQPSNRRLDEAVKRKALEILSGEVYRGFGPTLAADYLAGKHGIHAGRETVRGWMIEGKLWRARKQRVEKIHQWRQRRSRIGELIQWDTSVHAWLENRGPKLYLVSMIDDASSRLHARFVLQDSTEENMRLLWSYLERYGRPLSYYTDKASLFHTTPSAHPLGACTGSQRQVRNPRSALHPDRSGSRPNLAMVPVAMASGGNLPGSPCASRSRNSTPVVPVGYCPDHTLLAGLVLPRYFIGSSSGKNWRTARSSSRLVPQNATNLFRCHCPHPRATLAAIEFPYIPSPPPRG